MQSKYGLTTAPIMNQFGLILELLMKVESEGQSLEKKQ